MIELKLNTTIAVTYSKPTIQQMIPTCQPFSVYILYYYYYISNNIINCFDIHNDNYLYLLIYYNKTPTKNVKTVDHRSLK